MDTARNPGRLAQGQAGSLPLRAAGRRIAGRTRTAIGRLNGLVRRLREDAILAYSGDGRGEALFRIGSFAILVVLPVVVYGLYISLFASRMFETESRFAIRGATHHLLNSTAGTFGRAGFLVRLNSNQEAKIVENYIRSPGIIQDLSAVMPLREIYGGRGIDYWSRLPADATFDDLAKYWRKMVTVSVEAISGVVVVRVRAFSPDDALRVSQAILARAEALVERMVDRIRQDTLDGSEREVRDAAGRSAVARNALLQYRDREGIIDADKSAKALLDTISKLREDKLSIESSMQTMLRHVSDDSPTIREMRNQLGSLVEEIRIIETQLTRAHGGNRQTASEAIRAYEVLKIDSTLADTHTAMAEQLLTQARSNFEAYLVHVQPYVQPSLPQRSLYLFPTVQTLVLFLQALMLWTIGISLIGIVYDHDH